MTDDITGDDHLLARDLAEQAGRRLVELRAGGGDPDVLREAGDQLSHEFLTRELAARRPDDVVLSEEGADDPARLSARRVWIVDPLDGTREFGEPGRTDWAVHVALWERRGTSGPGDLLAPSVPGGPIPPDPPWGGTTPPSPRGPDRRRRRAPGPGRSSFHGHRGPTTTMLHRCCYNDIDVPSWW